MTWFMERKLKQKLQTTKQKIVVTIILLFMFAMVFTSFEIQQAPWAQAALVVNTSMNQNITAGTLAVSTLSAVAFPDVVAGTTQNTSANLTVANAQDYRGSLLGWSVTTTSTYFVNGTDTATNFSNAQLYWTPGTILAINGASNTGVTAGTAGAFDAARTLITATGGNGGGFYNVANTMLNLSILSTYKNANYNATMTFTIA